MKSILRYINVTVNNSLLYKCNLLSAHIVQGYYDSNFAGNKDNSISLSIYMFIIFGNVVSWKSNL